MAHVNNRYEGKQKDKEKVQKIIRQEKKYRKWWKRYDIIYDTSWIKKIPSYRHKRVYARQKRWMKRYENKQMRHIDGIINYNKYRQKYNDWLFDW